MNLGLVIGGGCVAAASLILFVIGIIMTVSGKKKIANCTEVTTGTVVKYRFSGGSGAVSVAPVAEFTVDGKTYKAYRHYMGVVSSLKKSPADNFTFGSEDTFFISDKDWFHVRLKGGYHNYNEFGKRVWPIGSEVTVLYNKAKPKQAYVDKVVILPADKVMYLAGGILFVTGIIPLIIGLLKM